MLYILVALFALVAISVIAHKKLNICLDAGPNCAGCPLAGSCSSSCGNDDDDNDDDDEDDD